MLTLENKYHIDEQLRQENLLTNEDLIAELTDHYSIALDEQLQNGTNALVALTAINADFGGRKGLQKLERQYNRVTFHRYEQFWWQSIMNQFKANRVICLLVLGTVVACGFWQTPQQNPWLNSGFFIGSLTGLTLGLQRPLWDYLKKLVKHGWHNPPTEVQFLLPRSVGVLIAFWLVGQAMAGLTPRYSWLGNTGVYLVYILLLVLAMNSYGKLYRHLYNVEDPEWV